MTKPERRRAPRATVNIPIHLSPRGESQPATLTSISTSGLACQFGEAMGEMTIVGIELRLPGASTKARVQGAVVRCEKLRGIAEPTYEIGIFFTDMTAETRVSLEKFMELQTAARAEN